MINDQQLKLSLKPEFSHYLNGHYVDPLNIELSVSGICKEGCPHCFYRGKQTGALMPFGMFTFLVKTLQFGTAITFTGGGEPTEHPQFADMANYACGAGMPLGLFTAFSNPKQINVRSFEWIRVSITERNIDRDFSPLVGGKKIGLCINYDGIKDDEMVEKALQIVDKHGFHYLHLRPLMKSGGAVNVVVPPTKFKHQKLVIQYDKFRDQLTNHRPYSTCEGYHFVPFIWETGEVYTCAYHRGDIRYLIGDLNKSIVSDIMNTAPFYVPVIETCQACCKNHEINKMLYRARNIEDKDFV